MPRFRLTVVQSEVVYFVKVIEADNEVDAVNQAEEEAWTDDNGWIRTDGGDVTDAHVESTELLDEDDDIVADDDDEEPPL